MEHDAKAWYIFNPFSFLLLQTLVRARAKILAEEQARDMITEIDEDNPKVSFSNQLRHFSPLTAYVTVGLFHGIAGCEGYLSGNM